MGFDSKFYIAAEAEMNAIRLKNERTAATRHSEIRSKYPDIAALSDELGSTSAKLFMLISAHIMASIKMTANALEIELFRILLIVEMSGNPVVSNYLRKEILVAFFAAAIIDYSYCMIELTL